MTSSAGIAAFKPKPKSIKLLQDPEPLEEKQPIIINKEAIKPLSADIEESKSVKQSKDSKFKKRFMNRLPINSGKLEDAGEYQWIHKPTCEIDLAHSRPLFHQLESWNTNLKELLSRLSKMQDGMKGELAYWNEMAKLLDAAGRE